MAGFLRLIASFLVGLRAIYAASLPPSDPNCADQSPGTDTKQWPFDRTNCDIWKDQGLCTGNPAYMLAMCKATCGFCESEVTEKQVYDAIDLSKSPCADYNAADCQISTRRLQYGAYPLSLLLLRSSSIAPALRLQAEPYRSFPRCSSSPPLLLGHRSHYPAAANCTARTAHRVPGRANVLTASCQHGLHRCLFACVCTSPCTRT